MINKRFSLHEAYSFGSKAVINHFTFFLSTIIVGSIASLAFLSLLGIVDYTMFKEHFELVVKLFSHSVSEPIGALHVSDSTVQHHIKEWLPHVLSKHLAPKDIIPIDITREDIMSALKFLVPVGLAFKLFLNIISVGWTKMALDIQANKPIKTDYIYKFWYYAPAVFIVELVTFVLSMVGLLLFILPGVFIYQRLRFARFFIIDKNQSMWDAMVSSWNLTDGAVLHLTGYTVFASLLNSVGHIVFVLTFFLIPLGYQVDASVYRQLTK